jgi:hypothetical protein
MTNELHIELKPDVFGTIDELLPEFPFEEGQAFLSFRSGLIVIDLASAEDSSLAQDWYLNENDAVLSYYVVED